MSRTYHNKRSFTISGKAGKRPLRILYGDLEASVILQAAREKVKLEKLRKRDRQWKLASASAADPRMLLGH